MKKKEVKEKEKIRAADADVARAGVGVQVSMFLVDFLHLIFRIIWAAGYALAWLTREAYQATRRASLTSDKAGACAGLSESGNSSAGRSSEAADAKGKVEEEVLDEWSAEMEPQQEDEAAWDSFELRYLREDSPSSAPGALGEGGLQSLVDKVQRLFPTQKARLSVRILPKEKVQTESAAVAILGPSPAVQLASSRLLRSGKLSEEEDRTATSIFAMHFTMREAWDLPQEDELVDASLEHDWVDLGDSGMQPANSSSKAVGSTCSGASPSTLLRERLREALPGREDLQVFMDANPWAGSAAERRRSESLRVDFVGPLKPEVWEAATRAVLACEASGVYLSRHCGAVFWCPEELPERPLLSQQVSSALSHWQGRPVKIGTGLGLDGMGFGGFEDFAANISAVLAGREPPGWHRLEWTPHGADAVPLMTY